MNAELATALVASVVAVAGIFISSRANQRLTVLQAELNDEAAERSRRAERHDVMSRRRDPLLWAAYDLQSRLFNIGSGGFLAVYYAGGSERDRAYARSSTLYVVADYLGQVEILRRQVQFLDLGVREENRKIVSHFTAIGNAWNSDAYADRCLQIFRTDQRAIGELMIDDTGDSCLGYASFCKRLDEEPEFWAWFEALSEGVHHLASMPQPHPRLARLQVALMDLIDMLDPEAERFPDRRRGRLPV